MYNFQDPAFLSALYANNEQILSRGAFLKTYSNRKMSLRDLLVQLLGHPEKQRMLDVGAGNCSFLQRMSRLFPDNFYAALDIVEHPACKACGNLDYRHYNGDDFPVYDRPFDLLFLMHMLYHVKDHGRFFHKVKELMADRHTLFITTKSQDTFPHMEQIFQDILNKMPSIAPQIPLSPHKDEAHFCAKNGEGILREHFNADAYTLNRYDLVTQIIVDRPQASFEYVFSTPRYNLQLTGSAQEVYQQLWLQALSRDNLFLDTYKETLYVLTH